MTRIEFYSNADSRLQAACQLIAKAFQQHLRVIVYAPDETAARGMDKLLWTFQATGFIPHCMAHQPIAQETPVVISGENAEMPYHQIMLNLHGELPPMFSRFERLIEVVGCDEEDRKLARNRYRHYRDRGYEILHRDLAKSPL
jgi:DNA polymerase-3 subunit chi